MATINGVWPGSAVRGSVLWHLIRDGRWLPPVSALLVFVVVWGGGIVILHQSRRERTDLEHLTAHVAAARAGAALENRLLLAISITHIADLWLEAKGTLSGFDARVHLAQEYPGVISLRLAPPGSPFVSGSLEVSGKARGGLLAVVPVSSLLQDVAGGDGGRQWLVELDMAAVAEAAGISDSLKNLRYRVSMLDRQGARSVPLLGTTDAATPMTTPETVVMKVLDRRLVLMVEPREGWPHGLANWSMVVAALVAAVLAFVTYHLIRQQQNASLNALRDPLTGLPNRRLFEERAQLALALAQRESTTVGVLFLDLDDFKAVNDHYGHGVGDTLLTRVTDLLNKHIRRADTLARIGGDEFAVLLVNLPNATYAQNIADKLIRCATQPVEVEGHLLRVGASIGISIYPDDARDLTTLLRLSDQAMYRAKRAGGRRHARLNGVLT